MWRWQPRLRCPHCRMLGYPDRAMNNLLPLGWECPACGAENAVTTNFCVSCGAGLASRCLRCEHPVYTAICPHCGAHQAAMLRYHTAHERRITWDPIVRAYIQEQQIEERAAQTPSAASPAQDTKAPIRIQQKRLRPSLFRVIGGLAFIILGVYLLEQQGITLFSQLLQSIASSISLPAWMVGIGNQIQAWWAALIPALAQVASLSNEDPRYVYLFATVVIGMAVLPLLFYLIERLARRIFP
ncbi:MAG: zinc ribbon domain-containing protein [Anaerolineae bacterium]|nr:zinc ribbon domain-containing protein [Anaerolineae bacterium]